MVQPHTATPKSLREQERKQDSKQGRTSLDRRLGARERLLRAGTSLIAELGLESINTNVIARRARVGVGTFYAHFSDKHELHRAVVMWAFERLSEALGAAAQPVGAAGDRAGSRAPTGGTASVDRGEIEVEVRRLMAATVDFASAEPELFKVGFGVLPPVARKGQPALTFSTRIVEQRLRTLKRQGQLDGAIDPEMAARGFAGLQNSILLWWLEEPRAQSRDQVIETLVRLHPAVAGRAAP